MSNPRLDAFVAEITSHTHPHSQEAYAAGLKAADAVGAAEVQRLREALHTTRACLIEAVRDNPGWANAHDTSAISKADALLNPTPGPSQLKRAVMWLRLLADAADVEPTETSIKLKVTGHQDVLAEVTLADDIAAIEALVGPAPLKPEDFSHVDH